MRLPSPQVNKSVFNSCLCPISNITTTYILSKLQLKLKSARGLYKPCMVSAPAHVQSMCALPSLSLSLYEQNFLGILQAPGHISPLALIKTRWAGGRPFFFFLSFFGQKTLHLAQSSPFRCVFKRGFREPSTGWRTARPGLANGGGLRTGARPGCAGAKCPRAESDAGGVNS